MAAKPHPDPSHIELPCRSPHARVDCLHCVEQTTLDWSLVWKGQDWPGRLALTGTPRNDQPVQPDPIQLENTPASLFLMFSFSLQAGALSVLFALSQPFGALLRCGVDHPKRPIFNWIHRRSVPNMHHWSNGKE